MQLARKNPKPEIKICKEHGNWYVELFRGEETNESVKDQECNTVPGKKT